MTYNRHHTATTAGVAKGTGGGKMEEEEEKGDSWRRTSEVVKVGYRSSSLV